MTTYYERSCSICSNDIAPGEEHMVTDTGIEVCGWCLDLADAAIDEAVKVIQEKRSITREEALTVIYYRIGEE